MKNKGPLITLGVIVLALLGALLINQTRTAGDTAVAAKDDTSASASPSEATEAPSSPAPAETDETVDPGPQFPAEIVYAGKDKTQGLAIAVAVKGGKAAAYLCDGSSVEAWLTGTADGDTVTLSDPAGGNATLKATLGGNGSIKGKAKAGDAVFAFAIGEAAPPAGLYRNEDGRTTIGWIVLPDGSQVGIQNTDGATSPAPALDPDSSDATAVTGDGF